MHLYTWACLILFSTLVAYFALTLVHVDRFWLLLDTGDCRRRWLVTSVFPGQIIASIIIMTTFIR